MDINNLSYEEAYKKLEELLMDLEKGDSTLQESLDKFKVGMELYDYCRNILENVEGQVKVLMKDGHNIKEYDYIREIENGY